MALKERQRDRYDTELVEKARARSAGTAARKRLNPKMQQGKTADNKLTGKR